MATGRPDPVESWAPMFLYFGGNRNSPKFSKEQVLDPKLSITFGHCRLCDDDIVGTPEAHMRAHRKELNGWLAKQRKQAEQRSRHGLKTHRQEQEMLAKAEAARVIREGVNGDDDDD